MQQQTLKDKLLLSIITGGLTFVILGPISGLLLDGYDYSSDLKRPLVLAIIAGLGRLLWEFTRTQTLLKIKTPSTFRWPEWLTHESGKQRRLLAMSLVVSFLIVMPSLLSNYWLSTIILCFIYILLGLGLNIVVGLAGLLDLGFVGFYAVGAYGYALGYHYLDLGFWLSIPCAALTAATFGVVLGFPVLRMHGDYLAIVTLGFGEIIRLILNNWVDFTGGPNGMRAPVPTFFGLEFTRRAKQGGTPFHEVFNLEYSSSYKYMFLYFVIFAISMLAIYFVVRLKNMPLGRAWEALREDEIACRSLGINHVTVKLSAFSMGAMIGGIAGVFFAAYQGFINPASFAFFESALILAIVVLGGMGSTSGVIIAAVVVTALPELLREFASYRILMFGLLMVIMMIVRPRGLIKQKRRQYHLANINALKPQG